MCVECPVWSWAHSRCSDIFTTTTIIILIRELGSSNPTFWCISFKLSLVLPVFVFTQAVERLAQDSWLSAIAFTNTVGHLPEFSHVTNRGITKAASRLSWGPLGACALGCNRDKQKYTGRAAPPSNYFQQSIWSSPRYKQWGRRQGNQHWGESNFDSFHGHLKGRSHKLFRLGVSETSNNSRLLGYSGRPAVPKCETK